MARSVAISAAALETNSGIAFVRREMVAGVTLALVALPASAVAGLLVFGQLGHAFFGQGILAGLYGAFFAGATAAIVGRSSFIFTAPVASIAIIPAGLVGYLSHEPAFVSHPQWIIAAAALCTFMAGILQCAFGMLNIGRIIKFTPHPVIAGFVNSVAMLIILAPMKQFFKFGATAANGFVSIDRPAMLFFVLALAVFIIEFGHRTKKLPGALAGLLFGTVLYYTAHLLLPALDLGPAVGTLPPTLSPLSALLPLVDGTARSSTVTMMPHLLLVSFTLAVVATLQGLLAFRVAQNLSDTPPQPRRDLIAQGVANCAAAVTGGIVAIPPPLMLSACFRAGGRTRLATLTCALTILVTVLFLASALAAIPLAVLLAMLMGVAYHLFDRWSIGLFVSMIRNRPGIDRRSGWQSLSVIAIVMLVTALSSIVIGALAGIALACFIFIVGMSRPTVRRCIRGTEIFSKRWRSADDSAVLQRTGARRVALELQGVLFFGNADDLASLVDSLLSGLDMILFNLRGVTDIDASGTAILGTVVARCRTRGKKVVLCNVREAQIKAAFVQQASAVVPDFDSALEWMEEETLRTAADAPPGEPIPLDALDMVKQLDADERTVLAPSLIPRSLAAGTVVCAEGEEADRMWIISKGSVSVRLSPASASDPHRIASMGAGRTVGEMALLEGGKRAATVVCDEDVAAYELSRATFDAILRDHPPLARKLYTYFAREMVQRIRVLHQDLRALND